LYVNSQSAFGYRSHSNRIISFAVALLTFLNLPLRSCPVAPLLAASEGVFFFGFACGIGFVVTGFFAGILGYL
jgi:hypothetical protein